MSAWKDLERRVCRALGAQRRPSVGAGGWARVAVLDFAALVRLGIEAGRLPAADHRGESMSSREQEPNPNESDAERIQREAREQAEQQQQQQQQRGEEGED
jgi:hypothetical protein